MSRSVENTLPDGWEEKKLGEILEIDRGGSPRPIKDYLTEDDNGLNWIKIGDATNSISDKYIYETKQKIKPEGLFKTRLVKEGDFILSNSMSFGKPYIMKTEGCIHDGWLSLKISDSSYLETDFLYYVLLSPIIYNKFRFLSAGTTVKNLNKAIVASVSIPLPPLEEQKRIVDKIDTLFAKIDKAISLTEESLIKAKNLLPSAITEITEISKANAWKQRRLGDILDIKRGGSPRPIKDFLTEEADGINWIKIGDATSSESEKYIYSTKEKIKPEGLSKTRYVKEGDFILSNSMSFGKPYIMKTDGCIHDGWLSLKIKDLESLNEDFLYYILSSSSIYNKFKALSSGTTVKNLNSAIVSSVSIPVPPLKEQLNIVKKLEAISNRSIQLELSLEKKLTLFRTMKSSILNDAFNGQLL